MLRINRCDRVGHLPNIWKLLKEYRYQERIPALSRLKRQIRGMTPPTERMKERFFSDRQAGGPDSLHLPPVLVE